VKIQVPAIAFNEKVDFVSAFMQAYDKTFKHLHGTSKCGNVCHQIHFLMITMTKSIAKRYLVKLQDRHWTEPLFDSHRGIVSFFVGYGKNNNG